MKLLSSKIFMGYLLVIIVLTGLILFFSFQTIRTHYLNTFIRNLEHTNITLQHQIIDNIENENPDLLDKRIKLLGKEINTRITVIDPQGNVLADSKNNPKKMENHKTRPEVQNAFNGKIGESVRFSTSVNDQLLYVAMPLYKNSNLIGVMRVSLYLSDIDLLTAQLTYDILKISFIMVVIVLVAVLFFSRNITKPLNMLSMASRKVADGNFDINVESKSHDEIKELADNFNNMAARLKELFSEVTRQKDELNTLIRAIQEGLVVFDTNGIILMANNGFCRIIKQENIIGKHYSELISDENFDEIFKTIIQQKESFTEDYELDNGNYLCSANFIETKQEVVFLLHDITEIRKLEKVKRDFVINVSHELRTPLTAIKGFVETLEDELEGKHEHYIDIIKRHTNRLINIVQDLLILADVEEPTNKLMYSSVDLRYLVDQVIKIFEQKLVEKNLSLEFIMIDDFPKIKLDNFKIEQVFVNLIDNAIKYTDLGAVKINISRDSQYAIIDISDTGVGIAPDDQARIFERFYIVDKSRSRRVGGTGLGLSIVKHIVLLHRGEISLKSEMGQGTTFSIKLPLDIK